jgi:hypothetical protein
MKGNDPNDQGAQLRQHPDYKRAIRAYSDEEEYRVKTVLERRFGASFSGDIEDAIAEVVEDSEVIEAPPGSCGWLYSYQGEKLLIGLVRLNEDKSGIVYGFQEC